MFHQWFNLAKHGENTEALINAINALGSSPDNRYGKMPDFEKKMDNLKKAFETFVDYCEKGHQKDLKIENNQMGKEVKLEEQDDLEM